jgi:anti-sigma regulatory factor (Ser/Thr protein kinase)
MTKQQFEFLNSVDHLTAAIKQMLDFIDNSLRDHPAAKRTIFKAKVIITELLTNSLKHSGTGSTLIDVAINKNKLEIIKTDFGAPLVLTHAKRKLPITNDVLHTLYAIQKAQNKIQFICEENNLDDVMAIDDIVENFGLMIITKAADNFIYIYEPGTKANKFKATLKIDI